MYEGTVGVGPLDVGGLDVGDCVVYRGVQWP